MRSSVVLWLLFLQLLLVVVLGHLVLRNISALQESRSMYYASLPLEMPAPPVAVEDPEPETPFEMIYHDAPSPAPVVSEELMQDMQDFVETHDVKISEHSHLQQPERPPKAAPFPSPVLAALDDAGSFAPVPRASDARTQGLQLFADDAMFNIEGRLGVNGFETGFDSWASPTGSYELLPPELRQLRV